MSEPTQKLWTPDGVVTLGQKTSERVELRAAVGEWLRQFADVATAMELGLHCSRCKSDIVGKNSETARSYAVSCQCRDFVWPNREYRESAETRH